MEMYEHMVNFLTFVEYKYSVLIYIWHTAYLVVNDLTAISCEVKNETKKVADKIVTVCILSYRLWR